ncbi:MAG: anti-sigma factor [Granulosicoccus sp.]
MNTPEEQWWMVRAGEYVLGTLRGRDLELFEKILAHDTAIQAEVARWEQQLSPLNETTALAEPRSDLLPDLLDRIREGDDHVVSANIRANEDKSSVTPLTSAGADSSSAKEAYVQESSSQSRLWPVLTALASAACLVLGLMLIQRTAAYQAAPLNIDGLAVVVSDENQQPYFLVETDYGNLKVRITALTPPSLDDTQKFQLWQALPDRSGVRPVSLLPQESGTAIVVEVSELIDGSDLFGVSIEPVGTEATDAGPTGPVVAHGDFLPKRNI